MTARFPTRVMGVATGCVLLAGGSAWAFFPPVPTGNGPVVVIPPPLPTAADGNIPLVPPVPAPPFTQPPPPRVVVPQEEPNPPRPETVPEPASMVSALAGLAALGAAARKRRCRSGS